MSRDTYRQFRPTLPDLQSCTLRDLLGEWRGGGRVREQGVSTEPTVIDLSALTDYPFLTPHPSTNPTLFPYD